MKGFGATHHNVLPAVRLIADKLASQVGCSWNTYFCHPTPHCLDDVSVDFWARGGRGFWISGEDGLYVAQAAIKMHPNPPLKYVLWRGRLWSPGRGWRDYGRRGRSHRHHVHMTFDLFSYVYGGHPPWP